MNGLTSRLSAYIKTQQQLNDLLFFLGGQRAKETFRKKVNPNYHNSDIFILPKPNSFFHHTLEMSDPTQVLHIPTRSLVWGQLCASQF